MPGFTGLRPRNTKLRALKARDPVEIVTPVVEMQSKTPSGAPQNITVNVNVAAPNIGGQPSTAAVSTGQDDAARGAVVEIADALEQFKADVESKIKALAGASVMTADELEKFKAGVMGAFDGVTVQTPGDGK